MLSPLTATQQPFHRHDYYTLLVDSIWGYWGAVEVAGKRYASVQIARLGMVDRGKPEDIWVAFSFAGAAILEVDGGRFSCFLVSLAARSSML